MITSGHPQNHVRSASGFTLVEVMISIAIVGVLASMAGTRYMSFVEKARTAHAIAEMRGIATLLTGLLLDENAELPEALSEVDDNATLDPWNNPYQYLLIQGNLEPGGGGPPAVANARKDRFLVPINSDFDLYSMGPDGKTKPPLQTPVSRDDIIRGSDGGFYGIAEKF